jgi:hypothetical protein
MAYLTSQSATVKTYMYCGHIDHLWRVCWGRHSHIVTCNFSPNAKCFVTQIILLWATNCLISVVGLNLLWVMNHDSVLRQSTLDFFMEGNLIMGCDTILQ